MKILLAIALGLAVGAIVINQHGIKEHCEDQTVQSYDTCMYQLAR